MFGLKATAFSAAGKERSVVTLAHCPVRAASACSGSSPLPRRHTGTRGSVCSAGFENDSNGAVVERVGAGDCVSRRTVRPGKFAGSEDDSNGALVECDGAGECVSRRTVRAGKALGLASVIECAQM